MSQPRISEVGVTFPVTGDMVARECKPDQLLHRSSTVLAWDSMMFARGEPVHFWFEVMWSRFTPLGDPTTPSHRQLQDSFMRALSAQWESPANVRHEQPVDVASDLLRSLWADAVAWVGRLQVTVQMSGRGTASVTVVKPTPEAPPVLDTVRVCKR